MRLRIVTEAFVNAPDKVKANKYEELRQDIKRFVNTDTEDSNIMVIAGRPGTSKSVTIGMVAQELGGELNKELPRAKSGMSSKEGKFQDQLFQEYQEMDEPEAGQPFSPEQVDFILQRAIPAFMQKKYSTMDPQKAETETKALTDAFNKGSEQFKLRVLNIYKPKSVKQWLDKKSKEAPPYNRKIYLGSQNPSSMRLYMELLATNGSVIVYDDSNMAFWKDEALQDIMLMVTQTDPEARIVSLGGAGEEEGFIRSKKGNYYPAKFKYTGKMILITNKDVGKLPANMQSRIYRHDFNPSSQEVLDNVLANWERIREKRLGQGMSEDEIEAVRQWLLKNVSGGRFQFDWRDPGKLFMLMKMYRDDPEEWNKRALKNVKGYKQMEKDPKEAVRSSQIRRLIKGYDEGRKTLTDGEKDRLRKFLRTLPDDELMSSNVMKTMDSIVGHQGETTSRIAFPSATTAMLNAMKNATQNYRNNMRAAK